MIEQRRDDPIKSVGKFLAGSIEPDDTAVSVKELRKLYRTWADGRAVPVLPLIEWGDALAEIAERIGLEAEHVEGDILLHGARIKAERRAA